MIPDIRNTQCCLCLIASSLQPPAVLLLDVLRILPGPCSIFVFDEVINDPEALNESFRLISCSQLHKAITGLPITFEVLVQQVLILNKGLRGTQCPPISRWIGMVCRSFDVRPSKDLPNMAPLFEELSINTTNIMGIGSESTQEL